MGFHIRNGADAWVNMPVPSTSTLLVEPLAQGRVPKVKFQHGF